VGYGWRCFKFSLNQMNKALQRVSQFSEYNVQVLSQWFERVSKMPGVNQIFKRIASTSDKEQIEDYIAEIRYALVFAGLDYEIEIEPLGRKGPDLKITQDDYQLFVEVTRFRKVTPELPTLDLSDPQAVLPEYGNPPRDIRKAFQKILNKFSQVDNGESIIAIWNDDEEMEELEVNTAVINLRNDAFEHHLSLPSGLLFVLYGSKWVRAGDNKQLHCFPLHHLSSARQIALQKRLDSSTVSELLQQAFTQTVT
jgi:hypothetical protein